MDLRGAPGAHGHPGGLPGPRLADASRSPRQQGGAAAISLSSLPQVHGRNGVV